MMRLRFLAFVLAAIASPSLSFAQNAKPDDGLAITVTHIDSDQHGFLITVEIANRSKKTLFLPQVSDWPDFKYLPRIYSLDVEQWVDSKTDLSPIGRRLQSVNPRFGFLSVGGCRDAVMNQGWIRLSPGKHISDQIHAIEPSSVDYGNSVCPLRMAHLGGKLRVSVVAFPSAHSRANKAISAFAEFPLPQH
jgi:hypothetical protein